jgi:nephrocystin-4
MFPHNNIIDHIYRFNERDNHRVKLTFPALYGYTVPSSEMRPILYSTDPNVAVEWSDDFQIRASLRVPEVRKQLDFNLLAYADSYFRELIANWQIHVNSLSGVSIEVPLGQVQSSKLTVHCEIPKSVRFYSSHPLTVWFPPPFDKNYMLTPGKINIININIRQFSEQIQRVLVNCVDTGSKELVYSWILNVAPTVPPISQVSSIHQP